MRPAVQPNFLSVKQFNEERTKKENWDTISSGETKDQLDEKFDSIQDRKMYVPGVFERNDYFDRIFPSLKV